MASISFIIPTLKRPEFLRRCLAAVAAQTVPASEVLIGICGDDVDSPPVLAEFQGRLPVRRVEAKGVGVVGSMNSCLRESEGDWVALLDDDVEIPPNWLETMLEHLGGEARAVGVSGRDLLQDHPEMRRHEKTVLDVGRIAWYGRVSGNHHRGAGGLRRVDVLRGSNNLYRGGFLREVGFETGLRGQGAQVNWELAIALQAKQAGATLWYDPRIEVLHHVAPRLDGDVIHRGRFDAESTEDIAFNETFVVRKHARGLQRMLMLAWQFAVGTRTCPGLCHALFSLLRRDPEVTPKVGRTWAGRLAALRRSQPGSRTVAGVR